MQFRLLLWRTLAVDFGGVRAVFTGVHNVTAVKKWLPAKNVLQSLPGQAGVELREGPH